MGPDWAIPSPASKTGRPAPTDERGVTVLTRSCRPVFDAGDGIAQSGPMAVSAAVSVGDGSRMGEDEAAARGPPRCPCCLERSSRLPRRDHRSRPDRRSGWPRPPSTRLHRRRSGRLTTSPKKLDPKLRTALASGANGTVAVFTTVVVGPGERRRRPRRRARAARRRKALVVGRIGPGAAEARRPEGRRSVSLVQLKQTGQPLGNPDPDIGSASRHQALRAARRSLAATDVPLRRRRRSRARTSRLKLKVLDAKTHNFADAWKAGYDGAGVTVACSTAAPTAAIPTSSARGRPDRTAGRRRSTRTARSCCSSSGPGRSGLSWYTPTQPMTGVPRARASRRSRSPRGPVRRATSARPPAPAAHTYTFPRSWSKSGKVRSAAIRTTTCSSLRRAAGVPGHRPETAGVYDTVYVDLNDDYDFTDEKPVTKASPASYRDLNGDGYTDLSGGLALLHLGRHGTTTSRRPRRRSASTTKPAPGAMRRLDAVTTTRASRATAR